MGCDWWLVGSVGCCVLDDLDGGAAMNWWLVLSFVSGVSVSFLMLLVVLKLLEEL